MLFISVFKSIIFKLLNRNLQSKLYRNVYATSKISVKEKSCMKIGAGLLLNSNAFLCSTGSGRLIIGNNVSFNRNTICVSRGETIIEDEVSIGPNCCIYDHNHNFGKDGKAIGFTTGTIKIGKNTWIGANCTILANTIIGDNCVIAAGTVVKGVIPSNSIVKMDSTVKISELK